MNYSILQIVCITAFCFGECVCGGRKSKSQSKRSVNSYKCCDQSKSTDCECSNQTGGVGVCMCSHKSNIRQNWLCVSDTTYGDSVSEY